MYVGKDRNEISINSSNFSTETLFFKEFEEELRFSTFPHLVKERKQLYYQEDVPEPSCVCEKI